MNAALGLRADFLAAGFLAAFLAGILGFSSWNGPPLLPKTGRTLTEDARPSKALSPSEDRHGALGRPPNRGACQAPFGRAMRRTQAPSRRRSTDAPEEAAAGSHSRACFSEARTSASPPGASRRRASRSSRAKTA